MGEIFWKDLFGRIFWEDYLEDFLGEILWEEFFVYIGIDLVFVKILSQWRRKEGQEFRSLEVREASSSHLKTRTNLDKILINIVLP